MSSKKAVKDKPVYVYNRVLQTVLGKRFFFCPKARDLGNGVLMIVGKKIDITVDLQPYLLKKHRDE